MKVRTIRRHENAYPPVFEKNVGRTYDVPNGAEKSLIANGYVELAERGEKGLKPKPKRSRKRTGQAGASTLAQP